MGVQHTNWGSRLEVDVKAKDAELEQLKTWHHRDVMKMKDLKEKVQQMLADRELRMVEERRKQEAESNALLEDERCVRAPVHSDGNSPATRPHESAHHHARTGATRQSSL